MNSETEIKTLPADTLKKFSVNFLILLFLFAVCLAIFLIVGDMVFRVGDQSFDGKVFDRVEPWVSDTKTDFFLFITFFGSHYFLLPAFIFTIVYFIIRKDLRHYAWKVATIGVTGTAVMFGLKELLKRERPFVPLLSEAHGFSFPSGHSFSSMLFFGMLSYIVANSVKNVFWRWFIIVIIFLMVGLIGFSRIYLKVHYATDVIAGFALGILWLLLAKWLLIDRRRVLPADNKTLVK